MNYTKVLSIAVLTLSSAGFAGHRAQRGQNIQTGFAKIGKRRQIIQTGRNGEKPPRKNSIRLILKKRHGIATFRLQRRQILGFPRDLFSNLDRFQPSQHKHIPTHRELYTQEQNRQKRAEQGPFLNAGYVFNRSYFSLPVSKMIILGQARLVPLFGDSIPGSVFADVIHRSFATIDESAFRTEMRPDALQCYFMLHFLSDAYRLICNLKDFSPFDESLLENLDFFDGSLIRDYCGPISECFEVFDVEAFLSTHPCMSQIELQEAFSCDFNAPEPDFWLKKYKSTRTLARTLCDAVNSFPTLNMRWSLNVANPKDAALAARFCSDFFEKKGYGFLFTDAVVYRCEQIRQAHQSLLDIADFLPPEFDTGNLFDLQEQYIQLYHSALLQIRSAFVSDYKQPEVCTDTVLESFKTIQPTNMAVRRSKSLTIKKGSLYPIKHTRPPEAVSVGKLELQYRKLARLIAPEINQMANGLDQEPGATD
ncbi:MAG: hypothetical protein LBJ89_02985 [Holosporales bacterium]|jgi:hypothetical protein|nr:hypothetical protein [Holosporales bacterium]